MHKTTEEDWPGLKRDIQGKENWKPNQVSRKELEKIQQVLCQEVEDIGGGRKQKLWCHKVHFYRNEP